MALITLAELLTAKSEAEQLSPGVLPAVSGAGNFNHGWCRAQSGGGGVLRREGGGR